MAIPINPLSDKSVAYKSIVDFYSARSSFAIPRKIILCLTDRCNMRCNMCTLQNTAMEKKELELTDVVNIIEELAWIKPTFLLFGGEPLLFEGFGSLLDLLCRRHCSAEVVTNGFFLEKYVDKLIAADVKLTVSMSGVGKVHDDIKNCPRSFQKIAHFFDILSRNNPAYFKNVGVNCVMTPDNIDGIEELIHFLSQYPISSLSLQHMQFSSVALRDMTNQFWRKNLNEDFTLVLQPNTPYKYDEVYLKKVKLLSCMVKKQSGEMNISFFPDFDSSDIENYYSDRRHFLCGKDNVCLKPWRIPTICPNGDVSNCSGMVLGNIKEQSFWEIWNGDKNNAFRDKLISYGSFPFCTRCCSFYEKYNFSGRQYYEK
ncbi:radical SAM protein [uncultured Bacteroides sp.]|uniref:radical SAM protein n=1 Tax=uncultured Bacteroides sp. TaxID=162156 RepID=UPI0026755F84|nr:radical SAM protein [uncultured Bacteroides sp.]